MSEDKYEDYIRNENGLIDYRKLERLISLKKRGINNELVKKHFLVQDLGTLLKNLRIRSKNTERNKIQINIVKNGLRDLKEKIEDMGDDEKEFEKLNEIVDIVEKILEFNNKNLKGLGLKILKPNQMLSRLPISLAQFKARNNSEKLKIEKRQLLYSLYRSKKITKTIYNNLINTI